MNREEDIYSLEIVKASNFVNDSFSKADFYNFLKENDYEKVAPGMYASKNTIVDNLFIIHSRCPQGIISHDEALYYYGLIDREPLAPTLTIYSGYNASKLKKAGYKVFFVKKEYLELGKIEVKDNFGNVVPMYDLDRTICDLIRNRNSFETQDFNAAIKAYARSNKKNLHNLFSYAEKLRVSKIVKHYMEILL